MWAHNKKQFQNWLLDKKLSASSISKYSTQSHNRILKDLGISFSSPIR